MPKFMTKDGKVVEMPDIPEPEPEPAAEPMPETPAPVFERAEPERETNEEALADLFDVPQPEDNDMRTDHLVELEEEEDLSDLVDVNFGTDIVGDEEPEPQQKRFRISPRGRRFIRRQPPPTSLGGLRVG